MKLIRTQVAKRIPPAALSAVEDEADHRQRLVEKLHEEIDEIAEAGYQDATKYADALQALMDLATVSGVAWEHVEHQRIQKLASHGSFLRGVLYDQSLDPKSPSTTLCEKSSAITCIW